MLKVGEIVYMKLNEITTLFLSRKSKEVFCYCGNRRSHNLIYCSLCGKKFSDGYTPKTQGEKIKWLIDKPNSNMQYPPKILCCNYVVVI